jgi:hypothetical protein
MSSEVLTAEPGIPVAAAGGAEPDAAVLRRYAWMLAGMALAVLACEAAAFAGLSRSPARLVLTNVGVDPCFTVAMGSVFFLHFWAGTATRELLRTLLLGLALAVTVAVLGAQRGLPFRPANAVCVGLGVASLAVLGWRAGAQRGIDRRRALAVFLPACLLTGSLAVSLFLLVLSVQANPTTFDAQLYAADGALGFQPSFVLGRLLLAVPGLALAAAGVYNTLPFALTVLLATHMRADPTHRRTPFLVFFAAPLIGFGIYLIFPAIGPVYAFGGAFPRHPPALADVLAAAPVTGPDPRNCMPSLHTTWALFLWWHARPLPRWFRALAGGFLAFTLLATLGFGLHYAFDLVVAFPFAMACEAAFTPAPAAVARRRLAAVLLGAGLVVAWLVVLRFGGALLLWSPVLTWAAALATVAVAVWNERELYRAASVAPPAA